MVLASAIATTIALAFLTLRIDGWQIGALALCAGLVTVAALGALYLNQRERPNEAILLILASLMVAAPVISLFLAKSGLLAGMTLVLVTLTVGTQTLPARWTTALLISSMVVAALSRAIELIAPSTQITLEGAQAYTPLANLLLGTAFGFIIVRQFNHYMLSHKLMIVFVSLLLAASGAQTFFTERDTRQALREAANQALYGAASQTAASLDSFIITNLDAIRTEAQLPVLAAYLAHRDELLEAAETGEADGLPA